MNINYKILMLDLDGTLLKHKNRIHKDVGKILKDYVEHGGIIAFNTGRSLKSALNIKDKIFRKYFVPISVISCFNGGIIFDCINNQIFVKNCINFEITKTIYEIAINNKIKLGIYNGIDSVSNKLELVSFKKSTIKFFNLLHKKNSFKQFVPEEQNNIYKILAYLSLSKKRSLKVQNEIIRNIEDKIPNWQDKLNIAKPCNILAEITNFNANKGKAIPYILEIINKEYNTNLKNTDICAIGDSENDFPMFGEDPINNPIVGLALGLDIKLNEKHIVSNEANKNIKKPHLLAKFLKNFVIKYN